MTANTIDIKKRTTKQVRLTLSEEHAAKLLHVSKTSAITMSAVVEKMLDMVHVAEQ